MEGQEPTPTTTDGEKPPEGQEPGKQTEPKTFDEDYVKQLRAEAAEWRTKHRDAEAKVKEFEDKDKSDSEKLAGKVTEAERRAQEAETKLLRLTVGQKKGLPPEIAELLNGKDEKEMADHADRLVKAGVKANGDGTTTFDGGARESSAPVGDMDAAIRAAAGR